MSFDKLFTKFTEIYWNLILKYNIKQKSITKDNKKTYLEQILFEIKQKYNISEGIPFESLPENIITEVSRKIKMKCKTCVVGALFEDTKSLFYSFSKKEEWIQINPQMYEFICKHKLIIEKLNYYEWAKFLEKVNDDSLTLHLLDKLDQSTKRNNLSTYRQILFEEFEEKTCFYCGRELKEGKVQVDHVIPWSFIKDDNLWNLVLSCSECNNNNKSDNLPDMVFLNALSERNNNIISKKNEKEMKNYRNEKLIYIYNWAKVNGYEKIWKPKSGVNNE